MEFLPRALQRGVGGDLLVGQHDLGRALLLGLGGLEGLCRALQADLLRPVELILRSLEALLALLQDPRIDAVELVLRALEVLLRRLQGALSLDRLVGQRRLLCAVKRGLGRLEVLRGCVLLGREGLASHALASLELPLRLVLGRGEGLAADLKPELVALADVEHAALVDGPLVRQGLVAVGLGVLLGDRRDAVDHGRHACALGHGAVDQAALVHVLRSQRAGALHERAVLGQQRLDLPGRSLRAPVHLSLLRGVLSHGVCARHGARDDPALG